MHTTHNSAAQPTSNQHNEVDNRASLKKAFHKLKILLINMISKRRQTSTLHTSFI